LARCLVAGRAVWFYAAKLVWPSPLTFIYPRWHIDTGSWWQYLFPLAAAAVLLILWLLRRRIGNAPLVAVLFFVGTLVPVLGFVNFYFMRLSFVADHLQYLPSVGLLALAAALISRALEKLGARPLIGMCLTACVLILLGTVTWTRGLVYRDAQLLWRDTLEKNRACWLAHNNLGIILVNRNEPEQAIEHFTAAIDIKPDYPIARFNLGKALYAKGELEKAKAHLREVLRVSPDGHNARAILGIIAAQQGRLDEAAAYLTAELQLHPTDSLTYYNLGLVRAQQKKWSEAYSCLRQACDLGPGNYQYHYALAEVLKHLKRFDEADEVLNYARRLERWSRLTKGQ
jgi:tetratricopeptide (TPR) repeat protein